jgi:hypothetical protein
VQDFCDKVEAGVYTSAELVNGNGFIEITDSWYDYDDDIAYFIGKFEGHIGYWDDSKLKNYVI